MFKSGYRLQLLRSIAITMYDFYDYELTLMMIIEINYVGQLLYIWNLLTAYEFSIVSFCILLFCRVPCLTTSISLMLAIVSWNA